MAERPTGSDLRRLNQIIKDLEALRDEMDPTFGGLDMKHFTTWDKERHALLKTLKKLEDEVIILEEHKKSSNSGDRSTIVITQEAQNRKLVKECYEEWNRLKAALVQDTQKKKIEEKEVHEREQFLKVSLEDIRQFAQRNLDSRKDGEAKQDGDDSDTQRTKRLERMNKKAARKAARKKGQGGAGAGAGAGAGGGGAGGGGFDDDDEFDVNTGQPGSAQEQQFMRRLEQSRMEEEQLLEAISESVTQLADLSAQLNKALHETTRALDDAEKHMDGVAAKIENANKKMEEGLENHGGLTRFIPAIIMLLIILSIIGFMVNRF